MAELTDPYEGERLDADWEQGLENQGVQEYADYALTLFYDPSADIGLDDAWLEIEGRIDRDARAALLGDAVASSGCAFDPGRMGSYFQTPAQVLRSVARLQVLDRAVLKRFAKDLETNCAANSLGVYITF